MAPKFIEVTKLDGTKMIINTNFIKLVVPVCKLIPMKGTEPLMIKERYEDIVKLLSK